MPTRTEVIQGLRARDELQDRDLALILDYLEEVAGSSSGTRAAILSSRRRVQDEVTPRDIEAIYDYLAELGTPANSFEVLRRLLRRRDIFGIQVANFIMDEIDAASFCDVNCGKQATLTDVTGSSYGFSGSSPLTDSKTGMFFAWVKSSGSQNGVVPPLIQFIGSTFGALTIGMDSFTITDGIRIEGADLGGNTDMRIDSDTNLPTDGSWVAIMASWDTATPGAQRLFLQTQGAAAVEVTTNVTEVNDTLDVDGSAGAWMGNSSSNNLLGWEVSTMVLDTAVNIDFGIAATRELFVTAAGQPVDIGDNAILALGQAAQFYNGDGSIVGDAGWSLNASEVAPTSVAGPGA